MKKTILFSSALVALAMLASCQKEELFETPATATGVTEFTATIESTKTAIAADGKVNWVEGDEITVTDVASKSAVYVAASGGESTTFTLKPGQTAVGAGPYKATYGDINKQKYSASGANCPLTAQSSTTNFTFSSPYAVVKLTAKSSGGELVKTVVVTYGDNGSFLDCGNGVTLTSAGVVFYVAVHESAVAAKLSVAFYRADGKVATKTRTDPISLAAKKLLPVKFESLTWSEDIPTFKAVYNTAGDANTLTFYYDTKTHSGEGGLYDNLPDAATASTSWGYNSIRGNIKSVKIDPSVAGYKGLTSTTYMFQLPYATSISGAEYLDVSNVTNMSYMFANFGQLSTDLNEVPDVSGWNTERVINMSKMFNQYGLNSTILNVVPDVSGWNTVNVTDMNNMFCKYGNGSQYLAKVPDVTLWNTGNVTNMSYMFSGYGYNSTDLTEVPVVSGWNTGKVENMSYMFSGYGYTSPVLNEVPIVSSWNTEKVKDWGEIFQNYGYSSTALTTVPDVSGWKTGSVTDIANMFNGYGSSSSNIDCVLDLSGWDLSNLSLGASAFKFKPKTFNVTIPAKTGETSNKEQGWFYGVFSYSIEPALKPGDGEEKYSFTCALRGVFSVSESKKVHFSKGNLWYGPKTIGASSTFNFETNQYDISSSWNASHVSNFYWSQTASSAYAENYDNVGTTTDVLFTNEAETTPKADFTVNGNAGVWRTLSRTEWQYLLTKHTYRYVSVNDRYGIVIAPDGYSGTIADSYDVSTWATAEAAGFVFLPSTGYRTGSYIGENTIGATISCIYWTSTASTNSNAYRMFFQWNGSTLSTDFEHDGERQWAVGIRLVTDVK